uniref:One cut domain family member n=1 Tax=Caenorhabditis tropicalis TaxID=1561998 RepID=A0A1I7UVD5_9PELO
MTYQPGPYLTPDYMLPYWEPVYYQQEYQMYSMMTPEYYPSLWTPLVHQSNSESQEDSGVVSEDDEKEEEVLEKGSCPPPTLTVHQANEILGTPIPERCPDTKKIANRITEWLKTSKTHQKEFSENVIGRSQGTLSSILKTPKPWKAMHCGREVFIRMYNFMRISEEERKQIMNLQLNLPKSTRQPRVSNRRFTRVQKECLDGLVERIEKPSKEIKRVISRELGLPESTVHNYFMNARRKLKYD